MGKEHCSHCTEVIIEVASESAPSVIRDGDKVFCNTFCYAGRTPKLKRRTLSPLAEAVGILGYDKVINVIRDNIDKINKGKRF